MSEIIVEFRARVLLDSEDPAITSFLRGTGMTLDNFLHDPEMVMDHILGHWDTLNIDIDEDEIDIDYLRGGDDAAE